MWGPFTLLPGAAALPFASASAASKCSKTEHDATAALPPPPAPVQQGLHPLLRGRLVRAPLLHLLHIVALGILSMVSGGWQEQGV